MKKLLSIILTITMLLTLSSPVFAVEATITVGINAAFKPFEYYDENGELTGFDIELMNYIGEKAGFEIEYADMSFDKLFPAVMSGEVDCAISAIAVTEERSEAIDYTKPYLRADVIYKNGEETANSIEEYAIVFPENSEAKARLIEASGDTNLSKYMRVNSAIDELTREGITAELMEKYNLNKPFDEEAEYNYTYAAVKTTEGEIKEDKDIPKYNSFEEAGLSRPSPSDWAKEYIKKADALNITEKGKPYFYEKNITREEFCELVYSVIKIVLNKSYEINTSFKFDDTDSETAVILSRLGIINGKSETEFAPKDLLTREEAATIIVRMINRLMPMAATEMWFEFDDADEISKWASDSVQTICNLGFMNGVGENKFAPKDNYTTQQAITTLVRVYDGAVAAGIAGNNADIGIIGGADGPTSIIIGDNINVIEKEEYDNFYVNISKNMAEVDDFYIDEAIKLVTESGSLAADREFIGYYTSDEEMLAAISELGSADYSKPSEIYYMESDKEQIISNINALAGEEAEGFEIEKLMKLNKVSFAVLPNLINTSYGAKSIAALTMLTNSRGYIMPKDFKNDFALYLEYDEGCSALVSFSKYGDGVISANMSFVINGDKDNIFRRLYEITSALGEDSIYIASCRGAETTN